MRLQSKHTSDGALGRQVFQNICKLLWYKFTPLTKESVGQISDIPSNQDVGIDSIFPVHGYLSQKVAADHVPIEAMRHKIFLEFIQPVIWQKVLNRTTQDASESSC